jgi:short-subunit dehydrogenase
VPTALVTGATAGIGRSFAHHLAASGHDLVLVARDRARLDEVARALVVRQGIAVEVLVADLANAGDRATIEARLADPARPIDLLVNNAGHGAGAAFLATTLETEEAMFEVNAHAVMRLTRAVLPGMVERRTGAVINVSSIAAWVPRGSYSASKAYVLSLSKSAALDVAPYGVVVQALCPGMTHTEFHARSGSDAERRIPGFLWLSADRVVAESLAALAAGRTVCIPSRRWRFIIAASRMVPARLSVAIAKRGHGEAAQPSG